MAKKTQLDDEQLRNDPSLRWNDYKRWEILRSDQHGLVRFERREGEHVVVSTLNGIKEIGIVGRGTVRRPNQGQGAAS